MLTHCPSCQNQLRVQDEFIGRKVRCPTCSAIFEATAPAPTPEPLPPGEEVVDYDPHADAGAEHDRPRRYRDDERRPRRSQEKPGKVQAIAIMTLIGGILATLNGLGLLLGLGISSFGICCLWPGPYYSIVLGILAIIKGSQLLGQDDWRQPPPKGIAIMQIINIINFDVANCVMGILTLVFLNERDVRRYYRG